MHRWPILLAALIVPPPALSEDCVKQVFRSYCLGGEISSLLQQREAQSQETRDGLLRHVFDDDGKRVEVSSRDGRIVSVTREEVPGSYLNFTDWKVKLVRLYGRNEDRSTFPSYAASRSARLNAINAGRGSALAAWPQDGWEVALRWDNPEFIRLEYHLDITDTAAPAEEEGL